MRTRTPFLGLVAAGLLLAGCAALIPDDAAPVSAERPADGEGFQDCEPPFVFDDESTLAALELDDVVRTGPEATRRGQVRITRDTITHAEFAPPGAPVVVPEGQVLCLTWPDGSGMAMMLPRPWPNEGNDADATATGEVTLTAPLLLGLAVIVIIGAISWIAFRRDAPNPR